MQKKKISIYLNDRTTVARLLQMMMMMTIAQSPYNEVLRIKRRTRGARALCRFSLVPLVSLCFILSLQLLGFQSPGVRRMSRMA
jgi:hypothetical protein